MVYEMHYREINAVLRIVRFKIFHIRFEYIVTNSIIILAIFMPILLKTEQTQYL